jgi:hypothetical protein
LATAEQRQSSITCSGSALSIVLTDHNSGGQLHQPASFRVALTPQLDGAPDTRRTFHGVLEVDNVRRRAHARSHKLSDPAFSMTCNPDGVPDKRRAIVERCWGFRPALRQELIYLVS